MKIKSSLNILILFMIIYSPISFASSDTDVAWKGTYYQAVPRKKNISQKYCEEHTPGSFIHSVKNVLNNGIKTDKGIILDHASFHEQQERGLYFINGDFIAHGKTNNLKWEEHIYYYFYKLDQFGVTRGVWSTPECKGLYTGIVINQ